MADIVPTATRRRMMAGIRSGDTQPERLIRSGLHRSGFRFRLHARDLPGRPDLVLRRWNAAIFVHGCFWHGHNCEYFRWPATRREFWRDKISRTRRRDAETVAALRSRGWRVLIVYECTMRDGSRYYPVAALGETVRWLHSRSEFLELGALRRRRERSDISMQRVAIGEFTRDKQTGAR